MEFSKRKKVKSVLNELQEIDYLDKLSPEDRDFMEQFLMEYYQADFNYETPIHPKSLRKDCKRRHHAAARQWDYVSEKRRTESLTKAIKKKSRFLPEETEDWEDRCSIDF